MTWAWIGALVVGVSLGLLGSGGSILTVPVLVYLVEQDEKVAIAGSLFIVGCVSFAGSVPHALGRRVDWRSVLWFGLPGMGGTYLGAFLSRYVSGTAQLALFALVMLLAAGFMLRSPATSAQQPTGASPRRPLKIALDGLLVGALTGLVGVGGGFLIVPALVLLGGMPMRRAVGTSLFVIGLKSASGFLKYLSVLEEQGLELDWGVLGTFSLLGIAGSFLGSSLSARLPQDLLRRIFGALLVVMAGYILWRELLAG